MQGPDEKIASAARDGALGPRGEERRGGIFRNRPLESVKYSSTMNLTRVNKKLASY
jgi:hypothetical protein